MSLSLLRAAGDIRPRRLLLPAPPLLVPPLFPLRARAQRARAAAAIFARVAADIVRRPVVLLLEVEVEVDRPPPTNAASRCSRASIWRRTLTASSTRLSDKSILQFLAAH